MAAQQRPVVCCLAVLLLISPCGSVIGYLSCITRDLDIDGFSIDVNHTLAHAYHLQTVVDDKELIPLSDPCPTCPSSYNILYLQDYQTILPVEGKLYIFTVIKYTPYSQIVVTAGCIPISIFNPNGDYFDEDTLYVECKRPSNPNQYFLAKLVKDRHDLQWSYQTLTNYDDLTSNGAFQYYINDFEQYEVYYAYARGDLLYFEGPDNGLYRFFSLPSGCAKVVRITRVDKHPHLLIECSNTSNSSVQVVNNVYIFEPDSGYYDPIFTGTAYSKCPVRFSNDGSIVAIFTGRRLLVKDLFKQGRSAIVEDVKSVYDGLLTDVDSNIYAAYINTSGLYTVNVTRALQGHAVVSVRVGHSEDVCAHTGCPLLEAIDTNTIVAQLNRSIATFSVHPPKLLNSSVVSTQPVRFIFYRFFPGTIPPEHLASTIPPEHPAATISPSSSILPHTTVTQPTSTMIGVDLTKPDLSVKESGNNDLRFVAFIFLPVGMVCCAIAAAVMVAVYRNHRGLQNRSHSPSRIPLMPLTTDQPVPPTDQPVPPTDQPVPPTDQPVPPTDQLVLPPTYQPVPPTDQPVPPPTYQPVPPPTYQPVPPTDQLVPPPTYQPVPPPTDPLVSLTEELSPPPTQAGPDNTTAHIVHGIYPTLTRDTPNDGTRD